MTAANVLATIPDSDLNHIMTVFCFAILHATVQCETNIILNFEVHGYQDFPG